MLQRLIVLLLIPQFLIQGFAFPHSHDGMSAEDTAKHDAQPHIHLHSQTRAKHRHAHGHDHASHHHAKNSHNLLAQETDSEDIPLPSGPHNDDTIQFPTLVYWQSTSVVKDNFSTKKEIPSTLMWNPTFTSSAEILISRWRYSLPPPDLVENSVIYFLSTQKLLI